MREGATGMGLPWGFPGRRCAGSISVLWGESVVCVPLNAQYLMGNRQ